MLEVSSISTGYGKARVITDVSFSVAPGEVVCLLGRNGAGKTTTMKALMGILPLWQGDIAMDGESFARLPPHRIASIGLGYIPQGRRLFRELTVQQNLDVGLMVSGGGRDDLTRIFEMFPRLEERRSQRAETLSGGEQQMLATARALATRPKVLLLDEPSEGLQPTMTALVADVICTMRQEGLGVLLVEQRVDTILSLADRVVFLEHGRLAHTASAEDLRENPGTLSRYLGV
ncbi:ABC transporter ATP-binding protein [Algicella marina]|uniref:ATP-binding cassette domain-containing protein n=1 Tax=Algicella marina TaxID=2683284 RepID=A0A6P1T5K9_9RHOB|nr:ABC transporter ATP-binding protein [Algicella marina]QHQ37091.1 ATP-binding cassette domain-containing protein [Algicella marina]